jgi:hypothetical protein
MCDCDAQNITDNGVREASKKFSVYFRFRMKRKGISVFNYKKMQSASNCWSLSLCT